MRGARGVGAAFFLLRSLSSWLAVCAQKTIIHTSMHVFDGIDAVDDDNDGEMTIDEDPEQQFCLDVNEILKLSQSASCTRAFRRCAKTNAFGFVCEANRIVKVFVMMLSTTYNNHTETQQQAMMVMM